MHRDMRRKNQELSWNESIEILNRATSGVLALADRAGEPYAVPMSFVYHDHALYFHCAPDGMKMDLLAENDRASFCVIEKDQVVPERFTTYFRSVIAFGMATVLQDEMKKRQALEWLAEKYAQDMPGREEEIQGAFHRVAVIELKIDRMTGKEAIELIRARTKKD